MLHATDKDGRIEVLVFAVGFAVTFDCDHSTRVGTHTTIERVDLPAVCDRLRQVAPFTLSD